MGRLFAEQTSQGFLLANDDLMLRVDTESSPFLEEYFAKDPQGHWCKILTGGNCGEGAASIVAHLEPMVASLVPDRVELVEGPGEQASLELDFVVDEIRIHESIRLGAQEEFFTFDVRVEQPRAVGPQSIVSLFSFCPNDALSGPPDFTWTPALRPEPGDVIGDHALRTPALVISKSGCSAVLIPDVQQITADRAIQTSADLDLEQQELPLLSYGLRNWSAREHTFYEHKLRHTLPESDTPLRYGLTLYLTCKVEKDDLLTDVSSFLWRHVGHRSLATALTTDPSTRASRCADIWHHAESRWVELPPTGDELGGIHTGRLEWANSTANDGDIWFNCWMQSLHTALGMFYYGRQHDEPELREKALATLNLALAAPQEKGIFPSIAYKDKATGELMWMRDSAWAGHPEYYHAMDCSWTAYWMLQFAKELPGSHDRIVAYCSAYAEFLLRQQKENGLIPSWYNRTLAPLEDLLYDINAETGTSALFLLALAGATGDPRYRQAGENALRFLDEQVLPKGYWFDHETFHSCSDKEYDFFDFHTQQPPQCTLSMIHTAMAYLESAALSQQYKPLETGVRVLSLLAMYQQLWNPPYFSIPTFGGFGVQNTDAEWSDARQAYCVNLFYDYFALTGNDEYRQRALAALTAAFHVAPAENWAHDLTNEGGAADCFHWGEGSTAAATAILIARHGAQSLRSH